MIPRSITLPGPTRSAESLASSIPHARGRYRQTFEIVGHAADAFVRRRCRVRQPLSITVDIRPGLSMSGSSVTVTLCDARPSASVKFSLMASCTYSCRLRWTMVRKPSFWMVSSYVAGCTVSLDSVFVGSGGCRDVGLDVCDLNWMPAITALDPSPCRKFGRFLFARWPPLRSEKIKNEDQVTH